MDQFFHVSRAMYREGDLVAPGNWGRIVFGTGPAHAFFYREYLFERVRTSEFPSAVSRMECAFAFIDFETAQKWPEAGVPEYVYLVEALGSTLQADMSWTTVIRDYRTFEGVEGCARHYWSGMVRAPKAVEILASDGLRVVKRLTAIPENGAS